MPPAPLLAAAALGAALALAAPASAQTAVPAGPGGMTHVPPHDPTFGGATLPTCTKVVTDHCMQRPIPKATKPAVRKRKAARRTRR